MTNVKDVDDLRDPDAGQLLHTPDPARLAYNGPDGFPRVIPIGFLWNGTEIVVCTAVTAPKVKALRERPNVAITIDDIGPPAKALLVRGLANVEIVDGVAPEYLAAAAKSTHGDELAAFEAQVRSLYKRMARIANSANMGALLRLWCRQIPDLLASTGRLHFQLSGPQLVALLISH